MARRELRDRIKSTLFVGILLVGGAYLVSDSMATVITVSVVSVTTFVVFESGGFVWKKVKPILPVKFVSVITAPYRMYFNFWRRILPDCVYKLWLKTDIMDQKGVSKVSGKRIHL